MCHNTFTPTNNDQHACDTLQALSEDSAVFPNCVQCESSIQGNTIPHTTWHVQQTQKLTSLFFTRVCVQVLVDGNFIHVAGLAGIPFTEAVPKVMQSWQTHLFVTRCVLEELKALGAEFASTLAAARRLPRQKCDHAHGTTAAQCIAKLVGTTKHTASCPALSNTRTLTTTQHTHCIFDVQARRTSAILWWLPRTRTCVCTCAAWQALRFCSSTATCSPWSHRHRPRKSNTPR